MANNNNSLSFSGKNIPQANEETRGWTEMERRRDSRGEERVMAVTSEECVADCEDLRI